ncbi:tyrosine-type recombinase/integrase [Nonomuraea sp. NPDC049684]|uniref:tyrosine-type recombinase/integrase n=1 Tax=Nonomuraea sp. NPDC049684 TaxID=3364356 RepID=UPI0037A2B559
MSTVIQASTEIDLEDATVARKKPEESTDRELVARLVDQARAEGMELVGENGRRAAELFEEATGGWTLHQLRHSALTHAAEDGADTSTLLAFSGHTSVASLARYARVSSEALGRWQAGRDPAARKR